MIYALYILFVIILFQDLKYRGIHWAIFPSLLMATIVYNAHQIKWIQIFGNLLFLVLLLTSLTLYLTIKKRRIVNITHGFFCWGDILFLIAVIPLYDRMSYMLFFTLGTLASLLIHLIVNARFGQKTIPFAGYMAFTSIFFLSMKSSIIECFIVLL